MAFDRDKALAALAAFQQSTGLRDFPWEEASGVGSGTLRKFRNTEGRSLNSSTYAKLAEGASRRLNRQVSARELQEIPGEAQQSTLPMALPVVSQTPAPIADDAAPFGAQQIRPDDRDKGRTMEVWASAEGGDRGAMIITTGPIDYIARPKQFTLKSFAVYLIGDSMSPAFEDGDQLYIDPERRPRAGHDCLFVKAVDETTYIALAKRLVRATADKWIVRQFNPPKDFQLNRAEWKQVWRVAGKVSRD